MKEKSLTIADKAPAVARGTAGMPTFVGSQPATVSALAMSSGGISKGRLVEPYA